MASLRQTLTENGFIIDATFTAEAKVAETCPLCWSEPVKLEDALELEVKEYGHRCATLESRDLEFALRVCFALEDAQRKDPELVALADWELHKERCKGYEHLFHHESQLGISEALEMIIMKRLKETLGEPQTPAGQALLKMSCPRSAIRISRAQWGFGTKNLIVAASDHQKIKECIPDEKGRIEPSSFYFTKVKEAIKLKDTDTVEILEITQALLPVSENLLDALEKARKI